MDTLRRKRAGLPRLTKKEGYTLHPFDAEYGVRTSGIIPGRFLKTGHKHDRHSTAYFGVAPSVFHALMRRWQRSGPCAPTEEFTFVDLGSGMGRAMLLASELPFRRVEGIELNPMLAGIARRNARKWRAAARPRAQIRVTCGDAVEFRFPKHPCIVFLFNPFGASVMRRLVARLTDEFRDRPGQLDVLYVNREQEHVFEGQRGFVRLFLGNIKRSRADAIADHRIMANQPDGEYEASNHEECSIWRWEG
ncbi:MAG: class I SAM-dependent methyltransferase [Acidobacteriales bacterium]|jgi:SAM-dependent methyltransferase|nr:class I SAM-dependent methyltransferase [Terriglobales bacterium]